MVDCRLTVFAIQYEQPRAELRVFVAVSVHRFESEHYRRGGGHRHVRAWVESGGNGHANTASTLEDVD